MNLTLIVGRVEDSCIWSPSCDLINNGCFYFEDFGVNYSILENELFFYHGKKNIGVLMYTIIP